MLNRLAVIGAGPKGVAIAAKAAALRHVGRAVPEVQVFDHQEIAAAWTGRHGYTDGIQPLCTLAERDLGYPYDNAFGTATAEVMMGNFSWQAFAVREGIGATSYREWIIRGRQPPSHADFAKYLTSAFQRSGALLVTGQVHQLGFDPGVPGWIVHWMDAAGQQYAQSYDGVVITGSGAPRTSLTTGTPERVFNAASFWLQLRAVEQLLQAAKVEDRQMVIIGGGGSAAAIANWFVRENIRDVRLRIIGREATLYSRRPSYFEERLFNEETEWLALAPKSRDEFNARLNSGVVWENVLEDIALDNISYQCGEFKGLRARSRFSFAAGVPQEWAAEVQVGGAATHLVDGVVFVDARGFDTRSFANWLTGPPQLYFLNTLIEQVRRDIGYDLSVGGGQPEGLHLPMLAGNQGPGAPNLMALGWMADRILRRYVTPPAPPSFPATTP